jgi:hypothetical protein
MGTRTYPETVIQICVLTAFSDVPKWFLFASAVYSISKIVRFAIGNGRYQQLF